jgi:hypothetical protein
MIIKDGIGDVGVGCIWHHCPLNIFTLKLGFKHGSMDSQGRGVVMQQQGILVHRHIFSCFMRKQESRLERFFEGTLFVISRV